MITFIKRIEVVFAAQTNNRTLRITFFMHSWPLRTSKSMFIEAYGMVNNKSAVTKFWVSRLIKRKQFLFFFARFLQCLLNWNGKNAVETFKWNASHGNDWLRTSPSWLSERDLMLYTGKKAHVKWRKTNSNKNDASCAMQSQSDPMLPMRWTDYHFLVEIEMHNNETEYFGAVLFARRCAKIPHWSWE